MTDIPTQRLAAVELALERFERGEVDLIDAIKADPEAAEHFLARIRDAGTKLPVVALGVQFAARQARFTPEALKARGINLETV